MTGPLSVHRSPLVVLALIAPVHLTAQVPPDLARERAQFSAWLQSAPLSPYAAVALQPVGSGVTLGSADADVVAPGLATARVVSIGSGLVLEQGGSRQPIGRGRPFTLGRHTLLAYGDQSRVTLAVFGPVRDSREPAYFPYDSSWAALGGLLPPERRDPFRVLGLDGLETIVTEAGFFDVTRNGVTTRLRVYRFGEPGSEEAELQIFFRDGTNGRGTYPAGRFVELIPAGQGRYLLDFNRARNPFCAYRSVYPCPAPWPGNGLPVAVTAGEQYHAESGKP
jgi:uncharacterized protein (DUF1684 family)